MREKGQECPLPMQWKLLMGERHQRPSHQLVLSWGLCEENLVWKGRDGNRPFPSETKSGRQYEIHAK
jgi:hypothetical protein